MYKNIIKIELYYYNSIDIICIIFYTYVYDAKAPEACAISREVAPIVAKAVKENEMHVFVAKCQICESEKGLVPFKQTCICKACVSHIKTETEA